MSIIIRKVSIGQWRPEKGWQIGAVQATVNGHEVNFSHSHGWRCWCCTQTERCLHIDQVAELIQPSVLDAIRQGLRHKLPAGVE